MRFVALKLQKDRSMRYRHAADIRSDPQRVKRDADSASVSAAANLLRAKLTQQYRLGNTRSMVRATALVFLSAIRRWYLQIPCPPHSAANGRVILFAN